MDTDKLTEIIKREVLRLLEERDHKDEQLKIKFCGNDTLLQDELNKNFKLSETGDILVVSSLDIDSMIDISMGKKHLVIEYILLKKHVYIVEEGLEYKKYSEPKFLLENYDKHLDIITKYGANVIKRMDLIAKLGSKSDKIRLNGVITESKLQEAKMKNVELILEKGSIITPLAMEYIKENNIEILYERG